MNQDARELDPEEQEEEVDPEDLPEVAEDTELRHDEPVPDPPVPAPPG